MSPPKETHTCIKEERFGKLEGDVRVLETSMNNLANKLDDLIKTIKWLIMTFIGGVITAVIGGIGYILTKYIL